MPTSTFEPCIPTKGTKVPDRPEWIHEVKHDGYRLIVQREGQRLRLNGVIDELQRKIGNALSIS